MSFPQKEEKMAIPYEDTLLYWLRQRPASSLSPQEVAHFIRQAADALQPLHNHRSVHGYVTPASFLVRPGTAYPGLPDLQLADYDKTQSADVGDSSKSAISLPSSLAPEQWSGVTVPASDQYALAVMAYQLLTWRSPFQGSQEQLRYQHLYVQPRPPSLLDARIPPALDAVILRALAKNPADRYPSVTAFAEAFQQALQPQQTLQPSPTSQPSSSWPPALVPGVTGVIASTPVIAADVAPQPAAIQANRPASSPLRESLILTLAFLLVVSGIGFGFYTIVNNNRIAAANTAVATQGAQNLTATAIANPNDLPAAVTSEKPLFADSLVSNDGYWDVNSTCVFSGGTYHVLQQHARAASHCGLNGKTYGDVAIQVDMSLLAGSTAGIYFRGSGSGSQMQFYVCNIIQPGELIFDRYATGKYDVLLLVTKNPAVLMGSQKNTLLVLAKGNDFKIYINGIFVGERNDSTSSVGRVGFNLETSASDPQGDASFANFKLYPLK